jgi:predicted transcriptional regulator
MIQKTTVAIDPLLRKRLKKIGALLDISQSEVIKRAIDMFEKELLNDSTKKHLKSDESNESADEKIKRILREANEKVCAEDPEHAKIQKKLYKGPITIDDVISTTWDSGLDL